MSKNFAFLRVVPIKIWGKGTSRAKSRTGRGWGLTGCAAHDLRFIETPNADARLLKRNAIVSAKTGWQPLSATQENLAKIGITGPEYLAEMAREMIAEKGIKLKSTQVKVAMLMCAVSPEFLRDGNLEGKINADKVRKWAGGTVKYLREKYGDSLLSVVFHLDEMNPHASAYLVPMLEKDIKVMGPPRKGMANQPRETVREWRMSHKDLFTRDKNLYEISPSGEKKYTGVVEMGTCSRMQDDYAKALQEMGLDVQRGIRKSDEQRALEYETNKERYRRLLAKETIKQVENLRDDELRGWILEQAPIIEEVKRARIERDHYQIAAGAAQQKASKLEENIADNKRELPVGEVITQLMGLDPLGPVESPDGPDGSPSPSSPKKRKDLQMEFLMPNGMRIGVNNQNGFENLTPEIPFEGKNAKRFKGKGALDAVMFLTGWDFDIASKWLADNYSTEEAGKSIATNYAETLAFDPEDHERILRKDHAATVARDLETPDDSKWESVRQTLLRTNKFRKAVIDSQHDANWIDANRYGHLVFQKGNWDENGHIISTGKIIVDPKNPTVTLKETGDNGLHFDIDQQATKVVICSSPMDALAIRSTPEHYASTVVVVGKSPNKKTIAALERVIKKHRGIKLLAENLTAAGHRLADWMRENFPQVDTLLLPKGFQNWLDYHKRPRLKSDPADLRVVEFPQKNQANPDDIAME